MKSSKLLTACYLYIFAVAIFSVPQSLFQVPRMSIRFNILAASSLSRSLEGVPRNTWNTLSVKAIPGLSFNRGNFQKNVMSVLRATPFKNSAPIIIWHDVISNSLAPFETMSESSRSSSINELKSQLEESSRYGVVAFCYLQRTDAETILSTTLPQATPVGMLYLNMKRIVRSRFRTEQLMNIHLDSVIECNFVELVRGVDFLNTLCSLPNKFRSGGRNRPSKKNWRQRRGNKIYCLGRKLHSTSYF